MSNTNTSRTLKYLKGQGWEAEIVERWLPNPKHPAGGVRKDLFGIIDIIAVADNRIAGVQSCGQAFSEHDKKIIAEPMSLKWIKTKNVLMLIGWRKVLKEKGGKLKIWKPRVKVYSIDDFKEEIK